MFTVNINVVSAYTVPVNLYTSFDKQTWTLYKANVMPNSPLQMGPLHVGEYIRMISADNNKLTSPTFLIDKNVTNGECVTIAPSYTQYNSSCSSSPAPPQPTPITFIVKNNLIDNAVIAYSQTNVSWVQMTTPIPMGHITTVNLHTGWYMALVKNTLSSPTYNITSLTPLSGSGKCVNFTKTSAIVTTLCSNPPPKKPPPQPSMNNYDCFNALYMNATLYYSYDKVKWAPIPPAVGKGKFTVNLAVGVYLKMITGDNTTSSPIYQVDKTTPTSGSQKYIYFNAVIAQVAFSVSVKNGYDSQMNLLFSGDNGNTWSVAQMGMPAGSIKTHLYFVGYQIMLNTVGGLPSASSPRYTVTTITPRASSHSCVVITPKSAAVSSSCGANAPPTPQKINVKVKNGFSTAATLQYSPHGQTWQSVPTTIGAGNVANFDLETTWLLKLVTPSKGSSPIYAITYKTPSSSSDQCIKFTSSSAEVSTDCHDTTTTTWSSLSPSIPIPSPPPQTKPPKTLQPSQPSQPSGMSPVPWAMLSVGVLILGVVIWFIYQKKNKK